MRAISSIIGINLKVRSIAEWRPMLEAVGMSQGVTDYADAEVWEHERGASGLIHLFAEGSSERGHAEFVIDGADYAAARDDLIAKGLRGTIYVPSSALPLARHDFPDMELRTYADGYWPSLILCSSTPGGLEFELFYARSRPGYRSARLEGVLATTSSLAADLDFLERLGFASGRAESGQRIELREASVAAYEGVIVSRADAAHGDVKVLIARHGELRVLSLQE